MTKFDVILTEPENSYIQFHYCRSWDIDPNTEDWEYPQMKGCYGTNPDHGLSFEQARDEIVEYLQTQYEISLGYDDGNSEKILENLDYHENITYNKWIKEIGNWKNETDTTDKT